MKSQENNCLRGGPEVLDCRRMINLLKWKESDNLKITDVSQWFCSYITELSETMLGKFLKFCTSFIDSASFDKQVISLDFSLNEFLPSSSACVPSICFFLYHVAGSRI